MFLNQPDSLSHLRNQRRRNRPPKPSRTLIHVGHTNSSEFVLFTRFLKDQEHGIRSPALVRSPLANTDTRYRIQVTGGSGRSSSCSTVTLRHHSIPFTLSSDPRFQSAPVASMCPPRTSPSVPGRTSLTETL